MYMYTRDWLCWLDDLSVGFSVGLVADRKLLSEFLVVFFSFVIVAKTFSSGCSDVTASGSASLRRYCAVVSYFVTIARTWLLR